MKKLFCIVLCLALAGCAIGESVYASYALEGHTNAPLTDDTFTVAGDSVSIAVMTTTDMHGRAYDWNSYTGSSLSNNYLQAAQIITEQRALYDDSIVLDNGDILQGSALSSYSNSQEAAYLTPMGTALRYIGYDAVNLGNHEFNYSPEIQFNFYNYLMTDDASLPGSKTDVVCANIIELESGESVFAPYKLFPYAFEDGTVYTIGVIAFENMNNANWDVASHYEGCAFAHSDNTEMSYVYEYTTYWQKELEEKADFIIVMQHCGEGREDSYNQENQAAWFIANTTGVDAVISGHSHGAVAYTVNNAEGTAVPVINAGGSNVGQIIITLTKTESGVSATVGEPTLIALNTASAPDVRGGDTAEYVSPSNEYNELKALIKDAFTKSDNFVNTRIGSVSGDWDSESSYYYAQSDSYDLVHKAQIWAVKTSYGLDDSKHIVSLTTPVASGSFTVGSLSGDISLKDCYSLYKYDNNTLFLIKMTGAQLKSWMQRTASTYYISDGTSKGWGPAPEAGSVTGGGFGTDQFYGVNYVVDMTLEENARVRDITWADGSPVEDDDEIFVAISSYRLSATENSDSYGWFASTGITSSSPEVLWDATTSDEFNTVGGSVPLIIGEYIKALAAEGQSVTPGSETHWHIEK